MNTDAMNAEEQSSQEEIKRLRARIEQLEAQVADVEAWANKAVADAQVKTYWLDRWHLDLNAVMQRRVAERLRAVARGVRSVYRSAGRLRRRS